MYPLCRREHKTLGRRSPVTNVPMILQSYSWREAIASILFPESNHAPWSEAEQLGRWGAWGLGGLLGQLGLGGASARGILLRVLTRLEDNRAEAVLRAVKQNSVPESMRPPPGKSCRFLTDACLCANLSRQGFKPSVNVAPNLIFS
jgi:hypothetical protein